MTADATSCPGRILSSTGTKIEVSFLIHVLFWLRLGLRSRYTCCVVCSSSHIANRRRDCRVYHFWGCAAKLSDRWSSERQGCIYSSAKQPEKLTHILFRSSDSHKWAVCRLPKDLTNGLFLEPGRNRFWMRASVACIKGFGNVNLRKYP